jgi:hypothetical protein
MDRSDGEAVPNVVIASNRFGDADYARDFFDAWEKDFAGVHVIVVADESELPAVTRKLLKQYADEVYDWDDINAILGKDAWIIPRRTSAIKSFGFLRALRNGALFIATLDDDVKPSEPGEHFKVWYEKLYSRNEMPEHKWLSTLNNHTPRGTPTMFGHAVVAHGGWFGVPDLNAEEQLVYDFTATLEDFVRGWVPHGVKFSMCGMNLAFRPSMTRHMYFGLQGHMFANGELKKLPYDRFDDIWAGIWVCENREEEEHIWTGEPFVIHEKASNNWRNLVKERPGLALGNTMFERFARKELTVDADEGYWQNLGEAYGVWQRLCDEVRQ